jgi:archaellum component FlaC
MLLIGAFAYYWFVLLPKITKFDEQSDIISRIIPKIGSDIDKMEEMMSTLDKAYKEFAPVYAEVKNIFSVLGSGVEEIRDKTDSLLTETADIRKSLHFLTAERGRSDYSRVFNGNDHSAMRGYSVDDLSVEQIRRMLKSEKQPERRDDMGERLTSIKNALNNMSKEFGGGVEEPKPFNLSKIFE